MIERCATLGMITIIVLLVTGCTTVDVHEGAAPGVRVDDPRSPQAGIRMNTVGIIDKSLQNWNGRIFDPPGSEYFWPDRKSKYSKIAVEKTVARRSPTGTLEVIAVLRNRTDQTLQIEGRVTFFDADEIPCEKPSAWQRLILNPQSVETYREFSTNVEDVAYYYIEIREGR